MGPTPDDELALLLAGTRARREEHGARIARLARRVDPDALLVALERQRLLALLGTRLEQAGLTPSEPFRAAVHAVVARDRRRALLFETATTGVLRALDARGIPAVVLKGAALARSVYGDAGLRRFGDVDVLVPAHALDAAVAALRALGYDPPRDPARHGTLPELHLRLAHPGRLPVVELHWRLHWFETAFSAGLLARSAPGPDGRRAQPADELAALLLFSARDGFLGLRLLADVAAWWDAHGHRLQPDGLEAHVARHPELRRAWTAAAAVAERLAGVPAARLLPTVRPDRRAGLAARLADWHVRGDPDAASATVTLVDGLLSPPGQLGAWAARHVVPPADVLEDFYDLPTGAWGRRLVARVGHPPKMAARYLLALWGVRRGRGPYGPLPRSRQVRWRRCAKRPQALSSRASSSSP